MIKLYRSFAERWTVTVDGRAVIVGGLEQTRNALWQLGVELEEIQLAFNAIRENHDDFADFGINRLFMYSSRFTETAYRA